MDDTLIIIAWSTYFESYIKAVDIISDKDWFFIRCDKWGNPYGRVMKARSNWSWFDWKKPKLPNPRY